MLPVVTAILALLLVTGCRVDTTVAVNVRSGGDGTVAVTVVLDHDAATRAGDLGRVLQLDDLRKAGWTITGPTATSDGGARVVASKPFGTPAQAEAILASLSGPDGPLRDVHVQRSGGFASTSYGVRATVDLHGGVDALGDPAFVKALGGTSVAAAVQALAKPGDPALASELGFRFAVTLPGGAHGAGATRTGDTATWTVPLGSPARTVSAGAQRTDTLRIALLVVAVVALLAAVGFGIVARRRRPYRYGRR